jgi:hypothetical protein
MWVHLEFCGHLDVFGEYAINLCPQPNSCSFFPYWCPAAGPCLPKRLPRTQSLGVSADNLNFIAFMMNCCKHRLPCASRIGNGNSKALVLQLGFKMCIQHTQFVGALRDDSNTFSKGTTQGCCSLRDLHLTHSLTTDFNMPHLYSNYCMCFEWFVHSLRKLRARI